MFINYSGDTSANFVPTKKQSLPFPVNQDIGVNPGAITFDSAQHFRRGAKHVDRILKGENAC